MPSKNTSGIKPANYRNLIEKALAQGWKLKWTGGTHIRLDPPGGGPPIFAAGTSGGGRGYENLRALLRRQGVDC